MTTRLRLFLLFGGIAIVFYVVRSPEALTLDWFGFGDQGANFTVDYLARRGLRPEVDFGYPYGLLSILSGRQLFRFFGYTALAYEIATLITIGFISWAFATIASCRNFKWPVVLLTAVAMPTAIPVMYSNLAHCAEASLISLGLAQHAQGNRARALAFATAASFAKPAMGYVYGLLLLGLIAREWKHSGSSPIALVRQTAPAIAIGIALSLVMMFTYGLESLLHTIVPLRGSEIYRAAGFGFFSGAGHDFWHPPHARIGYYIGTAAGFWILATLWILWSGTLSVIRLVREGDDDLRTELVACIAVMQAVFIFVMFGNAWSWWYYSYFLVIGAAISLASDGAVSAAFTGALIVLSIFDARGSFKSASIARSTTQVFAETAGLRASEAEYAEWKAALDRARGHRSAVLADKGGAALMFPEFEPPVAAYILPGNMFPADVARVATQLAGVEVIVRKREELGEKIFTHPESESVMHASRIVVDGRYFSVFERSAR